MHATGENAPPPRSLFTKLLLRSWEGRHPRLFWKVGVVSGLVLLGLGMFVLSYGSWWALPFLALAAANFLVGYRLYQATQSQPPT
jgi:fatty acid desaturase